MINCCMTVNYLGNSSFYPSCHRSLLYPFYRSRLLSQQWTVNTGWDTHYFQFELGVILSMVKLMLFLMLQKISFILAMNGNGWIFDQMRLRNIWKEISLPKKVRELIMKHIFILRLCKHVKMSDLWHGNSHVIEKKLIRSHWMVLCSRFQSGSVTGAFFSENE